MVVQVCSYLIERQHQAVDLHLAQNDHSASQLGRPSAGIGSNREARSEQKVELQQRLAQLRRTLNI
jgi:hypothetical protein